MSNNDISLSAAIRTSLISLQGTQTNINSTQNALSTGNKVNNAIDNPVAFFQSQALSDRASDFSEKKDGIDQGVSSLSTALEGVSGIESLVQQLKGLALNSESATSSQIGGLVSQFNNLRSQINTLAQDTQYQGLNLVAGTGQTLTVSFSTLTGSNLIVNSVDVTAGASGLAIGLAATANGTGFDLDFDSLTGLSLVGGLSGQTFLFAGTAQNLTSGTYTIAYGTSTLTFTVGSAGNTVSSFTTTQQFTVADPQTLQFLGTTAAQNGSSFIVQYSGNASDFVGSGGTITVDFQGLTATTLSSGTYTFSYGANVFTFTVVSAGGTTGTFSTTTTFTNGATLSLTVGTAGSAPSGANVVGSFSHLGTTAFGFQGAIEYAANTGALQSSVAGTTLVLNFNGLTATDTTLATGTYTFNYGSQTLSFSVVSAGGDAGNFTTTQTFNNFSAFTVTLGNSATAYTAAGYVFQATSSTYSLSAQVGSSINVSGAFTNTASGTILVEGDGLGNSINTVTGHDALDANYFVNALITKLDNSLNQLRTQAQTIGSNVALLNTRLDFTNNYINLLTAGSGKLTLADLNEEGANLLSLQTSQQLGIQALAFAGQNEKSVLSLFR